MSEVKELSADSKLEILTKRHETMSNEVKGEIQSRDRLLFYTLILIGVMSFQLFSPSTSGGIISEAVTKALKLSQPIDTSFTNTVMWFGLLALIVKYFQTAIRIERKRDYLYNLEKKLADYFDDMAYTWENPNDKDYPTYLHWVTGLYGLGLPVGFILVAIIKMAYEYTDIEKITFPLVLDGVAGVLIIAFIFQYLLFMYPRLRPSSKTNEARTEAKINIK